MEYIFHLSSRSVTSAQLADFWLMRARLSHITDFFKNRLPGLHKCIVVTLYNFCFFAGGAFSVACCSISMCSNAVMEDFDHIVTTVHVTLLSWRIAQVFLAMNYFLHGGQMYLLRLIYTQSPYIIHCLLFFSICLTYSLVHNFLEFILNIGLHM